MMFMTYICDFYGMVDNYIEWKESRVNNHNDVSVKLNEVCLDAKSLVLDDESEKPKRIEVVFADFEFQGLTDQDIEHNITITFDNIATIPCDAMAWSFPKVSRYYRDKNPGCMDSLPGLCMGRRGFPRRGAPNWPIAP